MTKQANPTTSLNGTDLVLWFDDLGTGNEEYRFLSNFYEGDPIILPGVTWEALWSASVPGYGGNTPPKGGEGLSGLVEFLTGEHAFAAMKFWGSDWTHFRAIVEARDTEISWADRSGRTQTQYLNAPNHAKSLGRSRQHPLREDWEIVKLDVMAAITRAKYALGRAEAEALVKTGDRLLVEGTYWGDEVWGVALDAPGLPGRNWLGTLLMARRAELRVADTFGVEVSDMALHFVNNTAKHNTGFSL